MRKFDDSFFSRSRFDGTHFFERKTIPLPKDGRSPADLRDYGDVFSEDVGRITHSSAFRRMQNKTQIYPLPSSDFLRNRLTHTIEVSYVGRRIALAAGTYLSENDYFSSAVNPNNIADIVTAACLAHDIGNPPFGHSGEDAIRSWFRTNDSIDIVSKAKEKEDRFNDFLCFDGNAQGFRVLTRTQGWKNNGGLRLSAATLGAFTKYPFSSTKGCDLHKAGKAEKLKFGFFQEDEHSARKIFRRSGMREIENGYFTRHPLSYIVEAADDIAYHATDLLDGFRYGSISFAEAEGCLLKASSELHRANYKHIDNKDKNGQINYLMTAVLLTLSDHAFNQFIGSDKLDAILSGTFSSDLLSESGARESMDMIKNMCKQKLYSVRSKLEIEIGGHFHIDGLLSSFIGMANEIYKKGPGSISRRNKNLFELLPEEVQKDILPIRDPYRIICRIVDFVGGMTDNYAIFIHNTIRGRGIV